MLLLLVMVKGGIAMGSNATGDPLDFWSFCPTKIGGNGTLQAKNGQVEAIVFFT